MSTSLQADTQEAPAKPRKPIALQKSALKLREFTNAHWRAVIPRNTPRERLLDSDFWAVVANDFQPFDIVCCVAEDRAYYAEILVIECGRGYASLVELNFTPLPALLVTTAGLPPGFEIYHAGPEKLYCIKRVADGVSMGEGFPSREKALEHLLDHASLR